MKQERLNLYYMDMKYVRDLHKADDRVQSVSPQIHKSNRPFVGIVVICDEHKYCIPLDSAKEKHKTQKNDVDFTRIFDGDKLLSVLNFNNMIPIDERFIKKVDLKISPKDNPAQANYKRLCIKEIEWCRKNQDAIVRKANKLYYLVQKTNCSGMLKKRCNDFKKLEKVLKRLLLKYK
ncbi:MAG: type III toxin-antitoxin system ToxN/AbiQ family toxin [Treponema sp.]|nr:type III toxin-antitoxin system ToxN/AbiQ family toxin [Candidatus Treponema merdequi]